MKKVFAYRIDPFFANAIKEAGIQLISIHELDHANEPNSLVLINGNDVSLHELFHQKDKFPSDITIVYHDTTEEVREIILNATKCSQKGIEYVSSLSTPEAQIEKLKKMLFLSNEHAPKIVGFFGSGTGVGCTSVSHLFAQRIAAAGHKVIHVGLDLFDPGWEESSAATLDNWRPKLTTKLINTEDFNGLFQQDGVTFLPGNFDHLTSMDYKADELSYLLERASEAFDIVVADFGSIVHSAAWYVGMQRSVVRYMVTQLDHQRRLQAIADVIYHLDLDLSHFFGIINKLKSSSGVTGKELERNLELSIIAELPIFATDIDRILPLGKKDLSVFDEQVQHVLKGFGYESSQAKRGRFFP